MIPMPKNINWVIHVILKDPSWKASWRHPPLPITDPLCVVTGCDWMWLLWISHGSMDILRWPLPNRESRRMMLKFAEVVSKRWFTITWEMVASRLLWFCQFVAYGKPYSLAGASWMGAKVSNKISTDQLPAPQLHVPHMLHCEILTSISHAFFSQSGLQYIAIYSIRIWFMWLYTVSLQTSTVACHMVHLWLNWQCFCNAQQWQRYKHLPTAWLPLRRCLYEV